MAKISTHLWALAYLHAYPAANGTAISDYCGAPADFAAEMTMLATAGQVTADALADGSHSYTLNPGVTPDAIMAMARNELAADPVAFETFLMVMASATVAAPPVTDLFRATALAAGLAAGDAHYAGDAVRALALVRKHRNGADDLIAAAGKSGRIADLAAAALA